MLPREGLGAGIYEPVIYSFIVCFLAWFFCFLYSWIKKRPRKKVYFPDFLIIFFINFLIFYACLVADLVRGWEFSTFAFVFFPLVFFIDSFFFLLGLKCNKDVFFWGLVFLLSLFLILPLIIYIREKMGWMPKLK
jgi:hypothetical protein